MPRFASKAAPTAEKLRGGYYTPESIARFLASWVAEAGDSLLEPSCGDGAVLRWLAGARGSGRVQGVEVMADEAAKARARAHVPVHNGDFFEWFGNQERGAWDGVAGNPPYIRFGNWPESARHSAFELMADAGLKPTRLTNAWVPFTVAAVLALRPGGRIGLVVPAELLQVGYAAQLRDFLASHLSEIRLVSFQHLVFEGVLQEVVLLLGVRGDGPATIKTVEVVDDKRLKDVKWSTTAVAIALQDHEKWTKYFLDAAQVDAVRKVRSLEGLTRLGDLCDIDVGVVTGRNSFFTLSPSQAREHGIEKWCVPLVARSSQLAGVRYDSDDLDKQQAEDVRCLLLSLDAAVDTAAHEPLASYLALGKVDEVPSGYKCSIRKQWWSVPSVWVPDAFMLRQLHTHPRLIVNTTDATSTDTVHRVHINAGVDAGRLAAGAFNSATFALAEVVGRSYGGGILELEPREAEQLLVPDPKLVASDLVDRVDDLVRSGQLEAALDVVDREVLIGKVGVSEDDVATLRRAWSVLRDRRGRRGRSSRLPR